LTFDDIAGKIPMYTQHFGEQNMAPNEEPTTAGSEGMPNTVEISLEDLKEARRMELAGHVREELEAFLLIAGELQKQIATAKTQTKKKYFEKKMIKTRDSVFRCLQALEMLGVDLKDHTHHDTTEELPIAVDPVHTV
jgi:predicted ribosome quality control (RQC) complex YloA/Tae2 family protein